MRGIFLFLFTFSAWGYNPYQVKSLTDTIVCDDTYLELKNTPPIREQGSIGICYAFSSLLLLEHLQCAHLTDPQSCYQHNRASAVDMTKFLKGKGKNEVTIGGDPVTVLSQFATERKLVNESCTHLDGWKRLGYQPDYEDFFHQIHEAIEKGANHDEILCFAQDLNRENMGPVDELFQTLLKARRLTIGQLRSELLYKKNCSAPSVTFPLYEVHTYPTNGESKTNQGIFNFVKKNLASSLPVEVSFCAEKDSQGRCYYHSTVITGMRNVCSERSCTVQYKIQNSYGKTWQDMHDDGWVNSTEINKSILNTRGLNLTSITPKGKSLPQTSYLAHRTKPSQSGVSCTSSTPRAPSGNQQSTIFECKDSQGRVHFSSVPLSGMFCKAR